MNAPAPATVAEPDRGLHTARENIEAVFVAYLMMLLVRCFFIEVFQIPSGSMESTLSGDARVVETVEDANERRKAERVVAGGDRIMAMKYFPAIHGIERYDVVIFRSPLNRPKVFIKRVVGLPGEQMAILRGNVYARPAGSSGPFTIRRKTLELQEGIWFPAYWEQQRHPVPPSNFLEREDFEHVWELPRDERVTFAERRLDLRPVASNETIRFMPRRRIENDEGDPVDDLMLALAVTPHGPEGSFSLKLEGAYGAFVLELSPGQGGTLTHTPSLGAVRSIALPGAVLTPSKSHRIRLMAYDGLCRAELDGEVLAEFEFLNEGRSVNPDVVDAEDLVAAGGQIPTTASFAARGLAFSLTELDLRRDIHYCRRRGSYSNVEEGLDRALTLPPDGYLVLGDSTDRSHDCRGWRRYDIALTDGRIVQCETIEVEPLEGTAGGLWIKADIHGNAYELKPDQIRSTPWPPGTAPQRWPDHAEGGKLIAIPRDNIIGTALCVWWPKKGGRGFRLIR
jgi:signal peptidase I